MHCQNKRDKRTNNNLQKIEQHEPHKKNVGDSCASGCSFCYNRNRCIKDFKLPVSGEHNRYYTNVVMKQSTKYC